MSSLSNAMTPEEKVAFVEDVRAEMKAISTGVAAIRETGITEDALIALIQLAAPHIHLHRNRSASKPSRAMIEAVIEGLEGLEEYVFGAEEDDD